MPVVAMAVARCVGQHASIRADAPRRPSRFGRRRLPVRASLNQHHQSDNSAANARCICAVKTPFLPSGQFDLGSYEEQLDRLVQNGVDGVVVGGTTGEGHLMSWDEHLMLIAWTSRLFGDKLKVIGNTGSNSTREAVHATEQGFAVRP